MRKLTDSEVKKLRNLKGTRGGADRFFDEIEEIYKNDSSLLAEILKCRAMKDSMDWIETYPAHEKTREMFYTNMDVLLKKIGYTK